MLRFFFFSEHEIQPLNQVSVNEVWDFCVLTKTCFFSSRLSRLRLDERSLLFFFFRRNLTDFDYSFIPFVQLLADGFTVGGLCPGMRCWLPVSRRVKISVVCGHLVCLFIVYLYVNIDSRSSWYVLSFLQPAGFDCTYWICRKRPCSSPLFLKKVHLYICFFQFTSSLTSVCSTWNQTHCPSQTFWFLQNSSGR